MNDENTVSLKVYLMEGKTNIEVRRFEVDHGVITNYDYIRERLQMAIPSLRDKIFRLLWQDSEGDEVTISSDEELVIALSELGKSSVCKFIVRLQANEEDSDTFININIPSMHSMFAETANLNNACPVFTQMQGDLNCSSCKQPISDVRYKCLECAEYCQCPDCEHKKVHPDHVMLRINKNFSLHSLIPKCLQIFKNHFSRGASKCTGMSSFFRDRMSQCPAMNRDSCPGDKDKDKGKCSYKEEKGSRHHHRRFRKHGHCDKGQHKSSSENEEPMQTECPFSEEMLGNLGNLAQMGGLGNVVEAFLGMYKNAVKKSKPENTEASGAAGPSTSTSTSSSAPSASATTSSAPIKTIDLDGPPMPTAPEDAPMQEETAESQKDAKIKMALELLADMGFNNDNQWLSRLLEHFDGDIAKTLDHLTLGK